MEVRELLRSLGLSAYEAEVYAALVRHDRVKVQDLARVISVPRPQIYVALGALMRRGMCIEHRGNVSLYSAVPPATAFRSTLRQEEAALKARTEAVQKLTLEHERLDKREVPPHFVQVLRGRQIKNFIDDLSDKARQEVLILLKTAEEQSAKSLEGAARSEIGMLQRGVRVRCLYELRATSDPELASILRRLQAAGEQGRVTDSIPMNVMIFDDRAALFSLDEPPAGLTVFAYTHPALVLMMRNSFQYLWDRSRSLRQAFRTTKR
jgi:sugar-specific transcriptional regulator TrmB